MTHDISLTTTEPTEVVGIVLRTSPATISQDVHHAYTRLSHVLGERHVEPSGPPRLVYEKLGPDDWTIECCIPADGVLHYPVASTLPDDVVAHLMDGGRAVHTTHIGPYDGLAETYGEVGEWLAMEGLHPSLERHQYDVYVNDPATVAPELYVTEVVVPVG